MPAPPPRSPKPPHPPHARSYYSFTDSLGRVIAIGSSRSSPATDAGGNTFVGSDLPAPWSSNDTLPVLFALRSYGSLIWAQQLAVAGGDREDFMAVGSAGPVITDDYSGTENVGWMVAADGIWCECRGGRRARRREARDGARRGTRSTTRAAAPD